MHHPPTQSPKFGPVAMATEQSGGNDAASISVFTRFADVLVLTKARVNVFVVATSFVGFALHGEVFPNWLLLLHTLAGTGLVAAAAAVANQVLEQQYDRLMTRTRNRPLASGRLTRKFAVGLSLALFGAGVVWLGAFVNQSALLIAVATFLIYVFLYTPLKRVSPACVLVGAVAGALPVLIGWAATGVTFGWWTFVAFGALFLWQIPHFLAIAWWRRNEYRDAGFRVLALKDCRGNRAAGWALVVTFALFGISFVPVLGHQVHAGYWPGALALGMGFSVFAMRFMVIRNEASARALFLASLPYLPALYVLLLVCRTEP